jgi:hypothetical protein
VGAEPTNSEVTMTATSSQLFYGSARTDNVVASMCNSARDRGRVVPFHDIDHATAESLGGIPDFRRDVWLFAGDVQFEQARTKVRRREPTPAYDDPFAPTGDTSLRECLQTMAVALSEALKKV